MFKLVLDFLFPARCVSCRVRLNDKIICANCEDRVRIKTALACAECGARLPELKKICHPKSPYIWGGACDYDGPVRDLILALKFKGIASAAESLGRYLASYAAPFVKTGKWTVVPLPLSAMRERQRGFNQTRLIAKAAAGIWNLPLADDILSRIRHSQPQTEMQTRALRLQNVNGCFSASVGVVGKNIILIDDVTTSGATLRAAALALKAAGARRILALAVAKA